MKIGTEEHFLRIERLDPQDPYSCFLMEAKTTDSCAAFYGFCDSILFPNDRAVRASLRKFGALKIDSVEFPVSGGDRLHLSRDSHGNILVGYRIVYWKRGPETGIDGVVHVDGEHSQKFIRDLIELLCE